MLFKCCIGKNTPEANHPIMNGPHLRLIQKESYDSSPLLSGAQVKSSSRRVHFALPSSYENNTANIFQDHGVVIHKENHPSSICLPIIPCDSGSDSEEVKLRDQIDQQIVQAKKYIRQLSELRNNSNLSIPEKNKVFECLNAESVFLCVSDQKKEKESFINSKEVVRLAEEVRQMLIEETAQMNRTINISKMIIHSGLTIEEKYLVGRLILNDEFLRMDRSSLLTSDLKLPLKTPETPRKILFTPEEEKELASNSIRFSYEKDNDFPLLEGENPQLKFREMMHIYNEEIADVQENISITSDLIHAELPLPDKYKIISSLKPSILNAVKNFSLNSDLIHDSLMKKSDFLMDEYHSLMNQYAQLIERYDSLVEQNSRFIPEYDALVDEYASSVLHYISFMIHHSSAVLLDDVSVEAPYRSHQLGWLSAYIHGAKRVLQEWMEELPHPVMEKIYNGPITA